MIGDSHPMRLPAAFATSAAIHAAVLGILLRAAMTDGLFVGPPDPPPTARLIKVSLISRPGGGGGGPIPGQPSPARGPSGALPDVGTATPPPLPQVRLDKPPPAIPQIAQSRPTPTLAAPRLPSPVRFPAPVVAARQPQKPAPEPAPQVASPPGAQAAGDQTAALGNGRGVGRGGEGQGTGDGSGGDGSDAMARPAHGANPKPPYPLAAKRMGVEGVVSVEVTVRPDGSPGDVRIRNSSGSPLLDDSAVQTVRSKWRFIPARRGDTPVESRVTFEIRFRLDAS